MDRASGHPEDIHDRLPHSHADVLSRAARRGKGVIDPFGCPERLCQRPSAAYQKFDECASLSIHARIQHRRAADRTHGDTRTNRPTGHRNEHIRGRRCIRRWNRSPLASRKLRDVGGCRNHHGPCHALTGLAYAGTGGSRRARHAIQQQRRGACRSSRAPLTLSDSTKARPGPTATHRPAIHETDIR
jgi:hypothetical protein